jgi:hypothetical protein
MSLVGRGRVAKWSREQIDRLTTPELRALLENAERLKESEIAAVCGEILDARPRGRPPAARQKRVGPARQLVSRRKAFEMHGAAPASRLWSLGAVRADGTVMLMLHADQAQRVEAQQSYPLWAPNVDGSHPWSDSPAGQERLGHCRTALERGAAEGLLMYGKRAAAGAPPKNAGASRPLVDAATVLGLRVEQRGEEYWAVRLP